MDCELFPAGRLCYNNSGQLFALSQKREAMGVETALLVLQFIVSLALIVVVLLQRSKGEGLGSIGGSARMFFDQARGIDRTLERATTVIAVLFMVLSVALAVIA